MTFRERLLARELLVGCFLNTGSTVAAEICAQAGLDWVLVDLEHGSATEADLLSLLHATAATTTLVRVEANERPRFAKVLDLGAAGVVVPRIGGVEDAARAVSHLRYGPAGVRGVALLHRAGGYGARGREHVEGFQPVGVVQIESAEAVAEAGEIAALDGVDCLFVGPNDLSYALGIWQRWEDERYAAALEAVSAAAARHGKAAGILARGVDDAARYRQLGYTMIGVGSDTSYVVAGARAALGVRR
ncbi:MAG TPA: aldolase/citrate lyase family protein [Gaiellaceae bacterium]|jgi:2-keto-3-deoxy-L-rhamnonate aldolase RhmA|nr:aldolase/citrate lyase family protein [Gaiellaceae bacterium]